MTNHIHNILYVDDEVSNLNLLKLLFKRQFNIISAESGLKGLEILESQAIDLIITDQRMPKMTASRKGCLTWGGR